MHDETWISATQKVFYMIVVAQQTNNGTKGEETSPSKQ